MSEHQIFDVQVIVIRGVRRVLYEGSVGKSYSVSVSVVENQSATVSGVIKIMGVETVSKLLHSHLDRQREH